MKTLNVWEIYLTVAAIVAVLAVPRHRNLWILTLVGKKSWLTASLQTSALVLCSQFVLDLSRQVAVHLPALESHLWHFDSWSEEFLDEVSEMNRLLLADCPKRFPVSQTNSTCQEDFGGDWEREITFPLRMNSTS